MSISEITDRVKEVCKFKEMIVSWTKKELKVHYKGSFLGFLWTFVNPLLQMIVYSVVFPFVMKFSQENYPMFLFTALLPWNFFTNCLQGGCGIFIWNSSLVTKVYFPREVLPISFTLSGLMNMIFSYAVVFPCLLIFRIPLTFQLLWLPVLMLIQLIFCTGITLFVSTVNVYFRDVEHLISVTTMALYFLTPVMYGISVMPQRFRRILYLNPMTGFIRLFREVTFYGIAPSLKVMLLVLGQSIITFIIGYAVFYKYQKRFSEMI